MKKIVSFLLIAALVLSFVPFSAFATEISSISYAPADENAYTFYEGQNCEYRNDRYYYVLNFNEGDVLTVTFSDTTEKPYTAERIDGEIYFVCGEEKLLQWEDVGRYDEQELTPWGIGEHTFYVEYAGKRAPVTANILPNPIDSISYTPRDGAITRYFETGGHIEKDDAGEDYYWYNSIEHSSGDILTVNYNDGRGSVDYELTYEPRPMYVSKDNPEDAIEENQVGMFHEQRLKHFTLGSDNCNYVEYMGKRAPVTVNIVVNPISKIVYTPADDIVIYENTNGEWQNDETGEPYFRYSSPWFKADDQLAITYSDSGNTVIYTYLDYYDYMQDKEYRGFYDGNFDELPDSEHDLRTSHTGEWSLGNDNLMCVTYKDNESNYVPVSIVENPVKGIRFERAEPVVLVENADIYHDDSDDRDYYQIPYHRHGDKLIIIGSGESEKTYDYQDNGVYTCEGEADIPAFEVNFRNDQHENPWGLGEHEYSVEYMGSEYVLTATVIANTVTGIEYIKAEPYEAFENTDGYYDDQIGYFHYWYNWCVDDDKLVVFDSVTGRTVYVYKSVDVGDHEESFFVAEDGRTIDPEKVTFDDDQRQTHWTVGDNNFYTVMYMGAGYQLTAVIKENPVKEIRFEPKNTPTVMLGFNSYIDQATGIEIFREPDFGEGDKLFVTDKNDVEKVYVAEYDEYHNIFFKAADGDEISEYDIHRDSNQYDEPWSIGDDNDYLVEYMGVRCGVKCTLVANPVDSIEFIPISITRYFEGTNGWYDPWDEVFYYDNPGVNNGDLLIVNYNDGRGRIEYTARFDNSIGELTFVPEEGDTIIADNYFDCYSDQRDNPWHVGENHYNFSYCGRETQVLVIIRENNITGISYQPKEMPHVWLTEYTIEKDEETGNEFKRYDIPDLQDGDVLTIHYNDDTSEDFVLTFDETDGENYFVSTTTTDKYHRYSLFCYDNQYEREWSLGTGNFFTIDFYGYTTDVEVEVIETDVESIKFTPVDEIVLNENEDGEYIYDDFGERFYFYNAVRIINPGDSLTVKYINGTETTYILEEDPLSEAWHLRSATGEELNTEEIKFDDHQWEKHWKLGKNYFDITYHGVTDTVPVIVKGKYIPGDINNDGEVNNKDLTRLFQYLSDWEDVEVNELALDVNGDNSVDNKDLTRLFQYLSNWDVEIF